MAKILFGGGVTAASGSVAGNVYSRNANGAYIRNKGIPTNANSLAQQSARAAFTIAAKLWQTLSVAQKQSFADQVPNYPYIDSLGQSKTYTASQLCSAVNGRIRQLSLYFDSFAENDITTMPAPAVMDALASSTSNFATVADTFIVESETFTGIVMLDPYVLLIDATGVLSPGVTRPKNEQFRAIQSVSYQSPTPNIDSVDILNAYVAKFGVRPSATGKVFVRCTLLNTANGQYSNSIISEVGILP